MLKDFTVGVAFGCHYCGADLTESDAVAPTFSFKSHRVTFEFNIKGRALKVAFR